MADDKRVWTLEDSVAELEAVAKAGYRRYNDFHTQIDIALEALRRASYCKPDDWDTVPVASEDYRVLLAAYRMLEDHFGYHFWEKYE